MTKQAQYDNRNTGASMPTKEDEQVFSGPFNYGGLDRRNEFKRLEKDKKTRFILTVLDGTATVVAQGEAVKTESFDKSMKMIPKSREAKKGSGQPPAYRVMLKDNKDQSKAVELSGWPAYNEEHDTYYIQWRPNASFQPIDFEKLKSFMQ